MSGDGTSKQQNASDRQRLDEILAELMRTTDEGHSVEPDEWLARYPDFATELKEYFEKQERVERLVRPLRQAAAQVLHVRCPHCHHPIELLEDARLDEVSCPSCGSSFSLVGEKTVSHYLPGEKTIGHFQLRDQRFELPGKQVHGHHIGTADINREDVFVLDLHTLLDPGLLYSLARQFD